MNFDRTMNSKTVAKVAVLVLGMHRSGTSLLGGILDKLGCQGARTPMSASAWNAKGYFESPEIMKLNDDILGALGSRWDDWAPLHPGWHQSPRFNEFRARMTGVMAAEYGDASLIYLKDPRICRLLPLWREVLAEAGYGLACIHTHRNPMDVTRSLQVRTGVEVEPGIGILMWLRHVLDTEAGTRGLPRIFTSYSRILSNWTDFSDQAERSFGFSWPLMAQIRDARVQEILDPLLRHHDTPVDAFLDNSAAPDLAKDCLRVLESWAENGEDEAGRETLDALRQRFDQSSELFVRPFAELAMQRQQMRLLQSGQLAAQEAEKKHEADIAALRQDLEARRREAEDLEARLEARAQELTSLRQELDQANGRAALIRAEAETRQAELRAELDSLADKIIDRDRTAISLRKEAGQANAQLTRIRAEAEAQRAKFQEKMNAFSRKVAAQEQAAAALRKKIAEQKQADHAKRLGVSSAHTREIEDLHRAYQSSTSWKISAPVRILGRMFKARTRPAS